MLLVRYHEAQFRAGEFSLLPAQGLRLCPFSKEDGSREVHEPAPPPFEGRQVGASSIVAEPHAQAALSKDSATRRGIFKRISKWISERISEWTQIQVPTADGKPQLRSTVK